MPRHPAIFLDKDGTILVDHPYNVDPGRMCMAPGAAVALRRLGRLGMPLIVVSNQSGVALGKFAHAALAGVQARLARMFDEAGSRLHGFYCCPHHPLGKVPAYTQNCECRKPAPGMLLSAAADLDIDLAASWMVGDILNDVEAGRRAACRTILIDNGNETEWQMSPTRSPDFIVGDLDEAARIVVSRASRPVAAMPRMCGGERR
jgi:D,D-heptose 1,7-bisphosphate phosphatase